MMKNVCRTCAHIADTSATGGFSVCDYWGQKRVFTDALDLPINCPGWSGVLNEGHQKPATHSVPYRSTSTQWV